MFPAPAGMNRRYFALLYFSGVFPAPAGMNRLGEAANQRFLGVPRARGDEPPVVQAEPGLHVFPAPAGMNRGTLRDSRNV